jgi:hypothetical protein
MIGAREFDAAGPTAVDLRDHKPIGNNGTSGTETWDARIDLF